MTKKEAFKFGALTGLIIICVLMIFNINTFMNFLDNIATKETINNMSVLLFGAIVVGMIGYVIYAFYRMIKFEKKSSKFRETMQLGDQVEFSSPTSFRLSGEVFFVDDEYVTISVKMRKHLVYPKSEK
jgi:uncharacterized integral membrane protein